MSITRRTALGAAALAAAAPGLIQAGDAAAQGAPPQEGPPFHKFRVGSLNVTVVTDGSVVRPIQGSVANATPEQTVAAARAAGIQGDAFRNPYNVTFVETPQGLVALDVGTGGIPNSDAGTMHANMRTAGLDPDRVVLIAHTHFHGDHINGLTRGDGTAVFPRAERVMVPEREWSFWTDSGEESRATEARRPGFANARRRFAPYEAKLARFAPNAEITPNIRSLPTNGHSPGHTSFIIHDGGQQALIIGDAVTTPFFFVANPEWFTGFDMDPPMAVETRKRLLDRAAAERMPVVGYHFPMPATGRVERAGNGYRLVPLNA
ncbi:MAG TPA: MBL fold metallo-hydrolase [Acetobacteraceae bacterium]|nr:MBL fold metallo-hydrolase [Acetobacteraceae bacterium]